MRQTHAAHYQKLEHVVQRSRVAHVLLHDGQDVLDVAQCARTEHALSCLHPRTVASHGVYFAVMTEQAEGLGEFPFRECIGGESAMHQRQSRSEVRIGKVLIEAAQLSARKHTFINNVLGR